MDRRRVLAAIGGVSTGLAVGCLDVVSVRDDDPEPVRTDHVVIPDRWVFEPAAVAVDVGATVTWTNEGAFAHTVTFDEPIDRDVDLAPGESVEITFPERGTYEYVCRFHLPDMVGQVVVS